MSLLSNEYRCGETKRNRVKIHLVGQAGITGCDKDETQNRTLTDPSMKTTRFCLFP